MSLLLQLAALQSFMLFVFFVLSRPARVANYLLGAFAIVVAFLCALRSVESIEFYIRFPHLIRLDWGMMLLLWPLIYLFVQVSLSEKPLHPYLHFLPYVINLILLTPFFMESGESKIQILNYYTPFLTQGFHVYAIYFKVLSLVVAIQSVVYSLAIIGDVKQHQQRLKEMFSNTDRLSIAWFYSIVYGMCALSITYVLMLFLNFETRYIDFDYYQFFYVGLFGQILVLSYRSFYQPASITAPSEVNFSRNEKAAIPPSAWLQESAANLTLLFEGDKLFLNPNLSASEVANRLNITRQQLSQLLTHHFKMNFYDFVNRYRVQEFQARLQSGNYGHLTLLGLALECGFNSKSSFNAVFKSITGKTPSAFAASIKS